MIGFVFQSFNLINYKNAMENVALPLFYQGVSKKEKKPHGNGAAGKDGACRQGHTIFREKCQEVRNRGWRSPAP